MNKLNQRYFTIVLLLLSLYACKKGAGVPLSAAGGNNLIDSAYAFFEVHASKSQSAAVTGNARQRAEKTPLWHSAYTVATSKGPAVVVPLRYTKDLVVSTPVTGDPPLPLNQLAKLIVFKSDTGLVMQLVTAIPLSKSGGQPGFSGLMLIESWDGLPIRSYRMDSGRAFLAVDQGSARGTGSAAAIAVNSTSNAQVMEICTVISGYNYSPDDPDDGYYWEETVGCRYEYLPADVGGIGLSASDYATVSGSGGSALGSGFTIPIGNNIIANISDYLKCFSNYGGSDHTYTVTVCVEQPEPGNRDAWAPTPGGVSGSSAAGNPVDVGHVFLVFSENFSDHSIVRNVGFYPTATVAPWTPAAQGQLNNDAGHQYNISLSVGVDNGQFFNMLNYVLQGNNPGFLYNLNTNNCTSFALSAMKAGGVILPATVGTWPDGGFGNDPGDLGEDIRNMTLASNMSRKTVFSTIPNQYTCY